MIVAQQLVKNYGPFRAVDHVSLEVKPGEILGFLGPNGAGKSTTMKMITGFLPPCSGSARIGDYDVSVKPVEARRKLGYLPERGPLYPEMSVTEFLNFIADLRELDTGGDSDPVEGVISLCNLQSVRHQIIDTLSKGFRQRVGLAQALMPNPDALILDEPTDGLDPNQKLEVRRLISGMAQEKAVILSTHILEEVEAMCNRVIIIANGRIVADSTPQKLLLQDPLYNSIILTAANQNMEELTKLLRAKERVASVQQINSEQLQILPVNKQPIIDQVHTVASSKNLPYSSMEVHRPHLNTVFHELTQGEPTRNETYTLPVS